MKKEIKGLCTKKGKALKGQVITKFPKAEMLDCTSHGKNDGGCYLTLRKDAKISHSDEFKVIIDFDKDNKILAIDFMDGLPSTRKRKK
jgi:hypothetical protein